MTVKQEMHHFIAAVTL